MALSISERETLTLLRRLDENARAVSAPPVSFVEPFVGCLATASSRRHHFIFGRRGSGKTSLLRQVAKTLSSSPETLVSFVDVEPFKDHRYPEVLLSILVQSLREFEKQLEMRSGSSFVRKLLRSVWTTWRHPQETIIKARIRALREGFGEMLVAEEGASLSSRRKSRRSTTVKLESEGGTEVNWGIATTSLRIGDEEAKQEEAEEELAETSKRNKIDFLLRETVRLRELLQDLVEIVQGDCFILLDDLYQLPRSDQVYVVDYFHRVSKGTGCWLKVGTIRYRSTWYVHGDPPRGMKLGDDCDEINLDIPLERASETKLFFARVLQSLLGIDYHLLLTADAFDQLIFASGGVARDFLTVLGRAVRIARDSPRLPGPVEREHILTAAFSLDGLRREELWRDALGEHEVLAEFLTKLQLFCLRERTNWFLIEADADSKVLGFFEELADLRFVHLIKSRVALHGRPDRRFRLFALDLSQCSSPEWQRSGFELRNPVVPGALQDLDRVPIWV